MTFRLPRRSRSSIWNAKDAKDAKVSSYSSQRVFAVFASFAFCVAATQAQAQTRRAMTVDDVLDMVQVSAPRISPDGRRVLYTVSELGKWKDNKRVTSTWMVNA